jgi:hypothetical protein
LVVVVVDATAVWRPTLMVGRLQPTKEMPFPALF